jgi:hypothetical protein
MIGFETKELLQKGQAKDFAVVDFRSRPGTGNQFPVVTRDVGVAK